MVANKSIVQLQFAIIIELADLLFGIMLYHKLCVLYYLISVKFYGFIKLSIKFNTWDFDRVANIDESEDDCSTFDIG